MEIDVVAAVELGVVHPNHCAGTAATIETASAGAAVVDLRLSNDPRLVQPWAV